MLRRALLWASTNPFLAERLPRYGFVKRATRRFMPGEELEDALAAASTLATRGLASTLTLLGEYPESDEQADDVAAHYRTVLERVAEAGLDAEISVKPTQLGLGFGAAGVHDRIAALMDATPSRVWIDMEGSGQVDATLELFRALRGRSDNVGLCLQAYLHRTEADLEALLPLDPSLRIVKGAYREPPDIAMPVKADVDRSFVRLTGRVLRAKRDGATGMFVVATHDPRMLHEAGRLAFELGIPKGAYEYALLYGIGTAEQDRLAKSGERVRVLISYGSAWFPWYMRRLAERPANLWFVAKQLLG